MTPHVMCAKCQHVFVSENSEDTLCPQCGYKGKSAGVMKPTGVPSLEVFKRNYGKANFPHAKKTDE